MKTVVYIDSANIILAFRRISKEIDFEKFAVFCRDKYRVDDLLYFSADVSSAKTTFDTLRNYDYKVVVKEVYYENSKTKANCDVEIAHRITRDIERGQVRHVVLASGDGDFSCLVDYAQVSGVDVTLLPVDKHSTSKILRAKSFAKLVFLEHVYGKIAKEKAPVST